VRISIITPCLNGATHIRDAIDSVLQQHHEETEHIIADGGSTDGTLDILQRYPHLRILSSRDRGIYDALNRALPLVRGELIGILNSDDCYAEDLFRHVVESFQDATVMAVAGEAVSFRGAADDARITVERFPVGEADLLFRSTLGSPCINAWFFRAAVFTRLGAFDPAYRIAGDREFMLRFACSGLRHVETNRLVCHYRIHPGSLTFGGNHAIWETVLREHGRIAAVYLRNPAVSERARALITQAHTRDTLAAAIYCARRREVRPLLRHAAAGTRYDPAWPARFAKRALRELAQALS
jgi:glycosyltransferase involved in cell wall biosynthesis